ncbi:hypothetical protein D5R81_00130 [Parashewanella spongiae]|uniref:Uncharacterized protein n=1 Tax=Parashewanella spongiae TaxID=342950 RepID=A0A3A6U264_9GAMM|nr:hypothetical protein [Parashewanella spongiae]MCL1076592.1 hypothetical protein [Parashewanella spongiae]RJY19548.1 hypothetical protein D5R81_00130 [Parashewanella spongiae]
MKHCVTLEPTFLRHDEMLEHWLERYPQLSELYFDFIDVWPIASVTVNALANFISNHLTVYDYSLFELCMTKAVIEAADGFNSSEIDLVRFNDSLITTTAIALKGIYIRNRLGFEWSIFAGVGFSDWLTQFGNNSNDVSQNKLTLSFENTAISLCETKNKIKKQLLCF